MKIQASQIKPGMVISRKIGKYDEIVLVTARANMTKIDYTHLDYQDAYSGLTIGTIDCNENVRIIKGAKRKQVLKSIKDDVFKRLHDTENIIDTLRLIEAMEKE